jgi:seryl-tRNA synthetase
MATNPDPHANDELIAASFQGASQFQLKRLEMQRRKLAQDMGALSHELDQTEARIADVQRQLAEREGLDAAIAKQNARVRQQNAQMRQVGVHAPPDPSATIPVRTAPYPHEMTRRQDLDELVE